MESITGSARKTLREVGLSIGRFPPGQFNAITDVRDVKVGHVTYIQDNTPLPKAKGNVHIRCGITGIIPDSGNIYAKRLVAGGFVLNGAGEITGLTQIMEWGWLETPILLTNTMSIGTVYRGLTRYMTQKYPTIGINSDVIIPVIGETNDSFLNDIRYSPIREEDVHMALDNARSGYVVQGSVGAGTGMVTCDFAGGIGTSSRILPEEAGGYTIGSLVLSNFGCMPNLTIDGCVIGRQLDKMFLQQERRKENYGSIIVVIGTDAPLMSSQLSRIAKRAALGVGRIGSYASSTSGEIMIAFSTGNRIYRDEYSRNRLLNIRFVNQHFIDPLYEAVIEATEEAILNAIFCSGGMTGRDGHKGHMLPIDLIIDALKRTRVQS